MPPLPATLPRLWTRVYVDPRSSACHVQGSENDISVSNRIYLQTPCHFRPPLSLSDDWLKDGLLGRTRGELIRVTYLGIIPVSSCKISHSSWSKNWQWWRASYCIHQAAPGKLRNWCFGGSCAKNGVEHWHRHGWRNYDYVCIIWERCWRKVKVEIVDWLCYFMLLLLMLLFLLLLYGQNNKISWSWYTIHVKQFYLGRGMKLRHNCQQLLVCRAAPYLGSRS